MTWSATTPAARPTRRRTGPVRIRRWPARSTGTWSSRHARTSRWRRSGCGTPRPITGHACAARGPGGAGNAMAWLGTEQHNLAAAQQAAAAMGLHTLAWQFGDTLWGLILHSHDHGIWAEVYETALGSAEACGDLQARYMARVRLAAFDRATGHCQTAREHARDALAASQ